VQDPVGMEIVDSVENLIEQRLDHALVNHHSLLVGLGGTVEFDDVLKIKALEKMIKNFRN
jgi:hypothetical protein